MNKTIIDMDIERDNVAMDNIQCCKCGTNGAFYYERAPYCHPCYNTRQLGICRWKLNNALNYIAHLEDDNQYLRGNK